MVKTVMSAQERYDAFKNGKCPYCGGTATMDANKRGVRGYCLDCKAENNFTNPNIIG